MTRVESLKTYLMTVLNDLNQEFKTMNINFLSSETENYSLDKIPTETIVEETITGTVLRKEVYNFRSRNAYGADYANNLSSMGFWEKFENKIYSNNNEGILPDIKGIKEIKCLNCGSLLRADTQTCEMSIQIQIDYEMEG